MSDMMLSPSRIKSETLRKVRSALTEARFRVYNTTRPRANAAIAEIARTAVSDKPGMILVEGLWDHPYHWLRLAMFRRALSNTAGGLLGVYEEGAPGRVVGSLRSLGTNTLEAIPNRVPEPFVVEAQRRLSTLTTTRELVDMDLPGGFPACHFYDGVLKKEYVGTMEPGDPCLPRHLSQTLFYLHWYDMLFDRHDIRAVVVSHANFPRLGTLVCCALRKGIPVFQTIHANEHVSARMFRSMNDYSGKLRDRPQADILDRLTEEQRVMLIEEGKRYYGAVRARQMGQFSLLDIYGKPFGSRDDFVRRIGADASKPNVVILTSCWSDGPNGEGPSHFTDYQDLLDRTLRVVSRVKDCNWIFRPHPAEFMYGDKMRLRWLIEGRLPDNAYLWPDDVGGKAITEIADCIVTPSGTSGIEYSALGKRVLACRNTQYTDWGICNWACDAQDFETKLARAWELPPPSKKQQEDAYIFIALTFTSPPNTRGQYLYRWGSESWHIWPSIPTFVDTNQDSIEREIAMLERWTGQSGCDAYNVFKWLHADEW
jgi:hypothetical protein